MSPSSFNQPFVMPSLETPRFPKTSRYHRTETAIHTAKDGTPLP